MLIVEIADFSGLKTERASTIIAGCENFSPADEDQAASRRDGGPVVWMDPSGNRTVSSRFVPSVSSHPER